MSELSVRCGCKFLSGVTHPFPISEKDRPHLKMKHRVHIKHPARYLHMLTAQGVQLLLTILPALLFLMKRKGATHNATCGEACLQFLQLGV